MPFAFVALLAAAAASPAAPAPSTARRVGRAFISPMGEPFRPATRDESGLAMWFTQADSNRDGQLTLVEMEADADRFFTSLDVNGDGEIDPDEISRYETQIAPEISGGPDFAIDEPQSTAEEGGGSESRLHRGGGHSGGRGGFFRGNDNDPHQGAARFGLLDLPEPVTAADFNFNRGISRPEFKQAAGQRFLALDLDHHGYLTLAGLRAIRPAPPARPERKVIPGQAPVDPDSIGQPPQ